LPGASTLDAAPIDDIRLLLDDWELHLGAKGRQASTISSYTTVAAAT
jgi:hypothetical protein